MKAKISPLPSPSPWKSQGARQGPIIEGTRAPGTLRWCGCRLGAQLSSAATTTTGLGMWRPARLYDLAARSRAGETFPERYPKPPNPFPRQGNEQPQAGARRGQHRSVLASMDIGTSDSPICGLLPLQRTHCPFCSRSGSQLSFSSLVTVWRTSFPAFFGCPVTTTAVQGPD